MGVRKYKGKRLTLDRAVALIETFELAANEHKVKLSNTIESRIESLEDDVEAIRALEEDIQQLDSRVEELESENKDLQERIKKLETAMFFINGGDT